MNLEEEKIRVANLPFKLNDKITNILDLFKRAVHEKNTSAVLLVDGRSGMGKTTLATQVGKYCDPDFDLHKIHYDPQTFLEGGDGKIGLQQAQKGDVLLFDEAMLISSRSALSYVNRMIVQAMSMIRSKNLIVIFCVNSIFDLDKNLAISRADLLLHVYGESLTDRGRVMAFFKAYQDIDRLKSLYLNGKKYYSYDKPRANFFTTFPSIFPVDEKKYEEQKQNEVNKFLSSMGGEKSGHNKSTIERDRAINYIYQLGNLTQEQIAEIVGCSPRTVTYAVAKHRDK